LDALGEQLSVTYGALRRDYTRVVRQRNALLKDGGDAASVSAWDEQLVRLGARLHVHRRRLARRVMEAAAPVYAHLAEDETLSFHFCDRCGTQATDLTVDVGEGTAEEALRAELARRREDELNRRVTLVGPHRDDITFLIGGRDARLFASQGQQRTIALAWKWAEISVIQDVVRRTPVLLLDDVMSELDEKRRHALTDLVQRDVQTFITTTNTGYFDGALLRAARVVEIGTVLP
jgi:DNA replication and repair protein RecF